ncbi:uncharacterized protein LOC131932743 [Physella acuta]|uniref:uncharacterized protein LOC131932743 n=1 Tax=Physella acuta TaxID=109671 RepID=UPI0027DC5F8F|nr:uncharacterized protein LOC131932743 [Physella acuta]
MDSTRTRALVCGLVIALALDVEAVLQAKTGSKQENVPFDEGALIDLGDINNEPLPEYYAARAEKKIISKFWTDLEKRRMAKLKDCEASLWNKTQNVWPVDESLAVNEMPLDINMHVEKLVPVYEGQAVVRDIETSLLECFSAFRKANGKDTPVHRKIDDLVINVSQQIDQLDACRSAGGTAPPFEKTLNSLKRIKVQADKALYYSEVEAQLESTVLKLILDKQTCFASLGLPETMKKELEYPVLSGSS